MKSRLNLEDGLSKDEILLEIAKYLQKQFISEETFLFFDETVRNLSNEATVRLINELAKEHKVIEIVKPWVSCDLDKSVHYCLLKPTEKLDEFCKGILTPHIDSNVKLTLTHKPTGELLINDTFLVCKTRTDSINDKVLGFLTKNPNRVFKRTDLEKKGILNIKEKEDKDFHVVVSDTGIGEDLKKLFFGRRLNKDSICLTSPVYQEDFDRMDIKYIDLKKIMKKKDQEDKEVD